MLTLIMLVNIVSAAPSANITFITKGSSFSPIITVTGNPTIQWIFGDGTSSNSKSPTINFGSKGTRTNTLVVTPWSAVTKINIGYDGSDGGITPGSSTIANLKQQNVIAVSGLENVAPYLQVWASNNNPITTLDFNNFTALHTIECFSCGSLNNISLRNVPALTRLCIEESNISYLDLSEAPALEDLRGASQKSSTYTINWGTIGANIWHICVRDNPQIKSSIPFSQFPLLRQFFNWNDNQGGILHIDSTNLSDVESSNNYYNIAIFSGCFPSGREGNVNIDNNNLIRLDISNDPGLLYLNASLNFLNQTSIDGILQTLDSYNTNSGNLDLTGNAAPSKVGMLYVNNLSSRGWKVHVSQDNDPPIANFTSSVTISTIPLEVQFNDTSINNPSTWIWDFGDGIYSTEESPKHVYASPGNYTVTHGVKNTNGSDYKVEEITVLEQPIVPIANFSSNFYEGYAPLNVKFTDLSENATEWNWNFGDGINSIERNPEHNYSTTGNYTVNLTVNNENGTNSTFKIITVLEQPVPILPIADFYSNLVSGFAPLDVQFTDLSKNATRWNWDFGDGTNSNEQNPEHYFSAGTYLVSLTVINVNGTASKSTTIAVLDISGASSGSSGGGGGSAGGSSSSGGSSPEPQSNVEVKEISQAFITYGSPISFDFPQKVTPVQKITFDSKKTVGKTSTIVESLKAKSTLVTGEPSNEVYKYLNIWVGNGGFATENNIGNAVVSFKVAKSWVQDKQVDKSSITLNRYSDNTWKQLSTSLSGEDDSYLYFTAQTTAFSSFSITGKSTASGEVQPADNKTSTADVNVTQTEMNTGNATVSSEQKTEQTTRTNTSGKGRTKAPGFETFFGIVSLLAVFLHKRK